MIKQLAAMYPVSRLCQVYDVSRSGYYASLNEKQGIRAAEDILIRKAILASHSAAPCYGVDNIHADVREKMVCGRNRVRRLMRELGVSSCRKRKFRVTTTDSNHDYAIAANLVKNLDIVRPNQVWVCDITYIQTEEGYLFCAIVKDKFTREIVGHSCGNRITSALAQQALGNAIAARQPEAELIHHSDRGVQYCCHEYRDYQKTHGITASMSKKGNPYDNAMAENFFCCMKCEKLYLEHYYTRKQAKLAVFEYIKGFYNTRRRHSALGRIPPAQFYREYQAAHAAEGSEVSGAGSRRQGVAQHKAATLSKTAAAARRGIEDAL